MVGILVTGHGHFATGLGSSMKLIAGENEHVRLVDFEADHSTETLTENLEKALDELKELDGVLILSDLAGGSPFKAAAELKYARPQQPIEVIAGSNLPMLIEGAMMIPIYDNPLEMAEALIPTGKDYIVRFELAEREEEAEDEDGI